MEIFDKSQADNTDNTDNTEEEINLLDPDNLQRYTVNVDHIFTCSLEQHYEHLEVLGLTETCGCCHPECGNPVGETNYSRLRVAVAAMHEMILHADEETSKREYNEMMDGFYNSYTKEELVEELVFAIARSNMLERAVVRVSKDKRKNS